VLDCFGGSGSTLIAAHKTGRRARLIEIDPIYVDRIIRRWEDYAKDEAILSATQKPYAAVAHERGTHAKGSAS
jgi:DNA modification methylase